MKAEKRDWLNLLDHAGVFLKRIPPDYARELVEIRKWGRYRGTGSKVRAVELVWKPDLLADLEIPPRDKPPTGRKYIYDYETRDNPPRVWTLKKLNPSLRPFFEAAVSG